jgi:hypothetical protein
MNRSPPKLVMDMLILLMVVTLVLLMVKPVRKFMLKKILL